MNLQRMKQLAGIKLTESVSVVPTIGESVNDKLRELLRRNPQVQALKAKAQENSKKGYVQHVNIDKNNNHAYISDTFDGDQTIASFENGAPLGGSASPEMDENSQTAIPNTQGAPLGSAGHNAEYTGFDASQGPATENVNGEPDTDCILTYLTSAWNMISRNMRDAVSPEGLKTISFIYEHLREPLMKGDLAGFEKAWEYCGAHHVDAADFFMDEVFVKAGLGDNGTYEEFMDKCKDSALEENDDDHDHDEDDYCQVCNGSGMSQHGESGCGACRGTGMAMSRKGYRNKDNDDYEEILRDRLRENESSADSEIIKHADDIIQKFGSLEQAKNHAYEMASRTHNSQWLAIFNHIDSLMKNLHEKAPPGEEKLVKGLKKEYPGHEDKAFATAWSIYNKKHGKQEECSMSGMIESTDRQIQSGVMFGARFDSLVTRLKAVAPEKVEAILASNSDLQNQWRALNRLAIKYKDHYDPVSSLYSVKENVPAIDSCNQDNPENCRTACAMEEGMNEEVSDDIVGYAVQQMIDFSNLHMSREEAINALTQALDKKGYGIDDVSEIIHAVHQELNLDNDDMDDEPMGSDDMSDDAAALASAGWGSDEDYGGSEPDDFPIDESTDDVREYESTGEAYDACQTGECPGGVIISVPSEQVVGISGTWPVALTVNSGDLHRLTREMSPEEKARVLKVPVETIMKAEQMAKQIDDVPFEESFNLNNGYDNIDYANGKDYFPDGADSPVVDATGPSGARQGDNPEQKKMEVTETHKELVYSYRNFLKESARK